jgi:hypothetical protein
MNEIVEAILEFVLGMISHIIYGTEDKPRHPIWRNTVRVIAFSGAFISAASLLKFLGNFVVPFPIIMIWLLCSVIVISAEYYAGSKKVGLMALGVFAALLVLAIITWT